MDIRKGRLHEAEVHLNEALEIYQQVYGEQRCMNHVNVASVHRQLGSTASALQDFDMACRQYSKALSIRENVCGETVSDMSFKPQLRHESHHLDVLHDLQNLAQAYSMKPDGLQLALDLFKKEKNIAEKLMESISRKKQELNLQRVSNIEEADINEISIIENTVSKCLLHSLYSLRSITKSVGDIDISAEYAKELQNLKKQRECKDVCGVWLASSKTSGNVIDEPIEDAVTARLLSYRSQLRNTLVSLPANESSTESVKQVNECLCSILTEQEHENSQLQISDSKTFHILKEFLVKLSTLSEKSKSLISQYCGGEQSRSCFDSKFNCIYKEIVDDCWVASDEIRQSMRQRGYSVTDSR